MLPRQWIRRHKQNELYEKIAILKISILTNDMLLFLIETAVQSQLIVFRKKFCIFIDEFVQCFEYYSF